jgi:uncharacterized cupredoxin-like copper-binding protein
MAYPMFFRMFLLILCLAAVAACGGGGSSGGSGAGQPAGTTKVILVDFKFQPKTMSATAGTVVFFLVNDSTTTAHDMVIADKGGTTVAKSSLVQPGNTDTFTVNNLKAGSYVFYCDLPGHRASGMEGTLTVS